MKKFAYLTVLGLALPALMLATAENANAQRKNYTAHDVKTTAAAAMDETARTAEENAQAARNRGKHDTAGNYKKHDKHKCKCGDKSDCKQKCMGMGGKLQKKINDVNEDYEEALEKINKSSFTKPQKDVLSRQAEENRNFSVEELKARAQMRQRHIQERMDAGMEDAVIAEKANLKAVKEVDDID